VSWLDQYLGPAVVRVLSTLYPRRSVLELEAGAGVTITASDVPANKSTKVTIASSSYTPPGAAGAALYKSGSAIGAEGNFLFDGAGRLTVGSSGFISYEAGSVPTTGFLRLPYSAVQRDYITRRDASANSRVVLGFTADAMTFGYPASNIAFQTAPGATFAGGVGVQFRPTATTAPTGTPTGGVVDYIDPAHGIPRTRTASGRVLTHDGCAPNTNGLRLTASSGNPIPTADVATATSVFLTPYEHGSIALFDQVSWVRRETSEVSLALGTLLSGRLYDVFAFWTGSAVALELSAAWTNDLTRADALTRQDGVLVKQSNLSRRYVGTIRTISTTQTTDTASQRFVYNEANQVPRHLFRADPTASWSYALTAFRQANGAVANRVEVVLGSARPVSARAQGLSTAGGSGIRSIQGIGVDSTTVNSGTSFGDASSSAFATETNAAFSDFDGVVAAGYHAINWLEAVATAASITLYGTGGGATSSLRARVSM